MHGVVKWVFLFLCWIGEKERKNCERKKNRFCFNVIATSYELLLILHSCKKQFFIIPFSFFCVSQERSVATCLFTEDSHREWHLSSSPWHYETYVINIRHRTKTYIMLHNICEFVLFLLFFAYILHRTLWTIFHQLFTREKTKWL